MTPDAIYFDISPTPHFHAETLHAADCACACRYAAFDLMMPLRYCRRALRRYAPHFDLIVIV